MVGVVDPGAVAGYLSRRFDAPVQVQSVRRTYPGMSRLTYLVRASIDGEARGLVLRCDPPGGGIVPLPLRREYDVYCCLYGSEVPVPEPLWFDEAPELTGGAPLMVRALVEGSARIEGLQDPGPAGDAVRHHVAITHARALATLHTLDWRARGLGDVLEVPESPARCAVDEVDFWWETAQRMHVEADPQLRRIMAWIREQAPTAAPRVALLKGNNGIDEELWADGRIVAMADWELAALGDPASDWAFSQGILTLIDPAVTLAAYQEAAGFAIDARHLAWYSVWTLVKVIVTARCGLVGVLDGRDPRPSLAAFGLGTGTRCEHVAARLVGLDIEVAASMLSGRQLKTSATKEPAYGALS
jgi:aminoglycoside phosphotransferase (APT) family kinase protein